MGFYKCDSDSVTFYVIIKITSINNLKFFERFRKFFFIFYFLRKEYFFKTFTNTLLIQLFAILKVFIVMKMFDLDVSLVEMIVLLPLINLFIAIPASITPWGWREFIFINILSYIGLTNEQSVLISLTNSVLLISVPFLFYLIFLRLR